MVLIEVITPPNRQKLVLLRDFVRKHPFGSRFPSSSLKAFVGDIQHPLLDVGIGNISQFPWWISWNSQRTLNWTDVWWNNHLNIYHVFICNHPFLKQPYESSAARVVKIQSKKNKTSSKALLRFLKAFLILSFLNINPKFGIFILQGKASTHQPHQPVHYTHRPSV